MLCLFTIRFMIVKYHLIIKLIYDQMFKGEIEAPLVAKEYTH